MTNTVITLQPAFVLQHRKYRETSLILEIFTRDFGLVSVLAKGVRKSKSKSAALLRPFQELLLSCGGKGDGLLLLTQVEPLDGYTVLTGLSVYCGFYLNELILRLLTKFDPHPDVYNDYRLSLLALANNDERMDAPEVDAIVPTVTVHIERVLRLFEINLLQHVGFGLQTDRESLSGTLIQAEAKYVFYPDQGAVEHPQGNVSGRTLLALTNKILTERVVLLEAKQLMRTVIDFHLQGKPLKSRVALSQIYQQL